MNNERKEMPPLSTGACVIMMIAHLLVIGALMFC
jgi:hypothetical protein